MGKHCQVAPKLCALFRDQLPGANSGLPYVDFNHEEVAIYHASPDAHLLPHNGGHNGKINIQMVLEGGEESHLKIHTDFNTSTKLEWPEKEAVAFADGWSWEDSNGPGERDLLSVGVFHPDIDGASYAEGFNSKTTWEPFKKGQLAEFKEVTPA